MIKGWQLFWSGFTFRHGLGHFAGFTLGLVLFHIITDVIRELLR
jgi:hypothetical protein